jgi:hypothetical protein
MGPTCLGLANRVKNTIANQVLGASNNLHVDILEDFYPLTPWGHYHQLCGRFHVITELNFHMKKYFT